jgi:ATP-dependent Clp protease adaptor protein ClpS
MPAPLAPGVTADPRTGEETRLAPMWRVLIHNDDVTPMDFVIRVLMEIWRLGFLSSTKIMLEAHFKGVALVCVEPREQAEFHIDQAHSKARGSNYPLTFTMEPEG